MTVTTAMSKEQNHLYIVVRNGSDRKGAGRIAFPPPKVGVTRTLPYPTRHHSGDCSVAVPKTPDPSHGDGMEDPPTHGGVTATYIRNSDKMYVYSRRVDKFVWIRRLPYVVVRTPELGGRSPAQ
ncbi:unnamed protein product [Boreogadus saida]